MTPETGREAECWIKLSLLTVLSVPEILRLLQQTGGVEALFDASSGTLTKLAGETAAREIREVEELTAILKKIQASLDEEIEQKRNVTLLRESYIKSLPAIREHFLNDLIHGGMEEA